VSILISLPMALLGGQYVFYHFSSFLTPPCVLLSPSCGRNVSLILTTCGLANDPLFPRHCARGFPRVSRDFSGDGGAEGQGGEQGERTPNNRIDLPPSVEFFRAFAIARGAPFANLPRRRSSRESVASMTDSRIDRSAEAAIVMSSVDRQID